MPLFHLHIRDKGELIQDPEGREFEDVLDAKQEAITSAREIMSDRVLKGLQADGSSIEITDVNGVVVLTVPFKTAIQASR